MKILNIKKWLIAAFVVSVILCSILLILNSNFNNVAYADSNSSSTSNTIQIDGSKSVYRGESEKYIARSTSDFSFIVFSVDDNNIIIQEVNEDSVILYITDDALLYSVFTLTAEDQVTNARATLQIMVLPVYADSIEKVGMSVGGVPIDSENPIVQPGDKIDIRIESFKVDDVVYGISNNVTYPDFAVVLDDSSTGLATIDEFKISVLVSESQTEDNPFIKFTIVVIQHKAPLQIQNLTKEIVVNIYNPVKSLTVEKISGESHRDSTLKYNVRYNANNVASIKGYKIRVVPIEDAIVDNESYFDVYSNTIYDFSIEIDKQAPYGAGITVYVDKMEDAQVEESKIIKKKGFENFDLNAYKRETFGMYYGEKKQVAVYFPSELLDVARDRFGAVEPKKEGDGYIVNVTVRISRTFFAWVAMFEGKVKILEPGTIKEQYKTFIERIYQSLD